MEKEIELNKIQIFIRTNQGNKVKYITVNKTEEVGKTLQGRIKYDESRMWVT